MSQPQPHLQGCHKGEERTWGWVTRAQGGRAFDILYFCYWKIAYLQAHSAAPSAALQACRSALFEKSWKSCFMFRCQWSSNLFMCRTPKMVCIWPRTPISKYLVPGTPQKQNLSYKCSLKNTFWRLFKNRRSTSLQRGTRWANISSIFQ